MSDVTIITSYPKEHNTTVFVDGRHLVNVTAIGVGQSVVGIDENMEPDVVIEITGEPNFDDTQLPELEDADTITMYPNPADTRVDVSQDFMQNILGIRFVQTLKTAKEFEVLFSPQKPVIIHIQDASITWRQYEEEEDIKTEIPHYDEEENDDDETED